MNRPLSIFGMTLPILACLMLQTQASAQPQTIELPEAMDRVLRDYETAWQARDAAGLAALFAEDGFVLSSRSMPVRGRAQIEQHYLGSGGPLVLSAWAYGAADSLGYIIGGFAIKPGEDDVGKYTLTLKKHPRGHWLIMSDMDNDNGR